MSQNPPAADLAPLANPPIPQACSERLWMIARVRGMQPAAVESARVLELGCGAGDNLIPQAERHPQGTCLGIDESPGKIAAAVEQAQALGLANIEFRRHSPLDPAGQMGTFDYLIASGLYSGLDAGGRNRLLAICRQCLAPQGVAFIDYDVYPGCHVRQMLRAMMRYEARGANTVEQRLAQGRTLLEFLQASLSTHDNPYGELLHAEVDHLAKQTDAWLRQNLLEAASDPVTFRQFIAHAKRHALEFLGDGTVGLRYTDALTPEIESRLDRVASDPLEKEQYRDLLRNKTRRQTLLCHDGSPLQRTLATGHLSGLYLEALLTPDNPDARIDSTRLERFVAAGGPAVSTTAPLIKAALSHLTSIWPDTIVFEDLAAVAWAPLVPLLKLPPAISPAETERLNENLLQCCAEGIVQLHGAPPEFATHVSDRPTASPLARWQAARGNVATNRRHQSVQLDYFDRHVVQLLDGTRGVAKLLDYLSASALVGKVVIVEEQQQVHDADRLRKILEEALPHSLTRLAHNALLIG